MDPTNEHHEDLARESWTPVVVVNNTSSRRVQQSQAATHLQPFLNAQSSSSINVQPILTTGPRTRREVVIHNDWSFERGGLPCRAIDYALAQGVPPPVAQLLRSIRASEDRLRDHVVVLQGIQAVSSTAISRIRRDISGYIAQVTAPRAAQGNADTTDPIISLVDLCMALEEIIRGHEVQIADINEQLRSLRAS
ncbi:MAG: hypothetical protein Q9187_001737 [Circinaria calcarea]